MESSPDSLAKLDTVLCEQLGGHAAQGSKHGPPGMDDLNLAIPAPTYKPVTTMQCTLVVMHNSLKACAETQDGCIMLRLQCTMRIQARCLLVTWRRSRGQLIVQLCPSHSHQGTHLCNSAQTKYTLHFADTYGHCSSCSRKLPNVDLMYLCQPLSGWMAMQSRPQIKISRTREEILTGQVRRDRTVGEGAQPLGTVGTCM